MKKKVPVLIVSGVLACALTAGATACDGKVEFEREAAAFEAPKATISLDGKTDKKEERNRISDTLFGVFLEDINYASYALDDNLLVNYSFEPSRMNNTKSDYGWTAKNGATLGVKINQADGPLGGLYKSYDNIYINGGYASFKTGAGGGSLENAGFPEPAMAVKKDVGYLFSAFIRNNGAAAVELKIAVKGGSATYAEGTVSVAAGTEWIKYQKLITAQSDGDENLFFELSVAGEADLSLDAVKLETTDATLGIKNYLFKAVEELSPKFIRFPGGCVIEGVNEATAYDWKNSVGAVATGNGSDSDKVPAFEYKLNNEGTVSTVTTRGEQITRRANTDIWWANGTYYEMEYALGFFDYFMLCDKIGASPVPVISCGLSDQGGLAGKGEIKSAHALAGRHGNKIDDYIQDAKDLVCFANGSVNAADENERYWAQLRSDMGHPAPFAMDYIGIGNEQWGNYYTDYYEKFLEAFKEAAKTNSIYASVQPIVGNCTRFLNCEAPAYNQEGDAQRAAKNYLAKGKIENYAQYGVVDQHYYMNYTDFLLAATNDVYAGYTRPSDGTEAYKQNDEKYYEVFVGEYAANNRDAIQYPVEDKTKRFPFEFNGWLSALSEAALMTTFESNGDIVRLAAYAPMFANLNEKNNQWAVDMMFYNNTDVVLTGNYYVQQLFMNNAGDHKITSAVEYASGEKPTTAIKASNNASYVRTVNDIYYVTTADEETGDIIIKIVNAGDKEFDFNVALGGFKSKNYATVTILDGAGPNDKSTLEKPVVTPVTYSIGGFTKGTFGYTVTPYSVTAIRVRTK